MKKTEYRKFRYKGVDFIVGTDGSVDGRRKHAANSRGYMTLNRKVGKKKITFKVHDIIAHAWLEPPLLPEMNEIDHKNGIKTDNRAENLRWVTHQENMDNRVRLRGTRVVAVNTESGMFFETSTFCKMERILGIDRNTIAKYAKLNKPFRNYYFVIGKSDRKEEV